MGLTLAIQYSGRNNSVQGKFCCRQRTADANLEGNVDLLQSKYTLTTFTWNASPVS